MTLKHFKYLFPLLIFSLPTLLTAQENIQKKDSEIKFSPVKAPSSNTKVLEVGDVRGLSFYERNDPETESKKLKEIEDFRSKNETIINEFKAGKTIWKLTSIDIDKSKINENKANFDKLYSEAQSELKLNLIFVESESKALFATTTESNAILYHGEFEEKDGTIILHHQKPGCDNCNKDVFYTRTLNGNELQINMRSDDSDKSDVYYVLSFVKV